MSFTLEFLAFKAQAAPVFESFTVDRRTCAGNCQPGGPGGD
jgi:hypothetical protein